MKTSPPEGVRAMGAFRAHTTLRAVRIFGYRRRGSLGGGFFGFFREI
ncbi:MAG: hypothetical protein Q4G33_00750 [bacterium]|nr:hypothetical protein [bacterium]